MTDTEKLEWIWANCKVVHFPKKDAAYPIEHAPHANKDSRKMIEAQMPDSSPSSSCSLESDVKALWRSMASPIGGGGGLYTEGYQKSRAEIRLALGNILINHKVNILSIGTANNANKT